MYQTILRFSMDTNRKLFFPSYWRCMLYYLQSSMFYVFLCVGNLSQQTFSFLHNNIKRLRIVLVPSLQRITNIAANADVLQLCYKALCYLDLQLSISIEPLPIMTASFCTSFGGSSDTFDRSSERIGWALSNGFPSEPVHQTSKINVTTSFLTLICFSTKQ